MAVKLKEIKARKIAITITSISPMIQHRWAEKAKRQMREKQAGKKTKTREIRDPEAEVEAATYVTKDGEYGIPAMAFKSALITAAHKDVGIEKTLVRKSFFIPCSDPNGVIPIKSEPPAAREDMVRVGAGSADLRYRPEFAQWTAEILAEYDAEMLTVDDIVNLVNRAGFGVGIGEWRPEKGGEYGRFQVDTTVPVREGG